MKPKILVIDDEESIRYTFENFLLNEGYEVATARDFTETLDRMDEKNFDIIFADIILGDKTGIDVLREVKKRNLHSPVIIITGYPNVDTAADAVRLGAFDYISKPVTQGTLLHVANMALQYKNLADKNEKYRSNIEAIFRSVKDAIVTVDKELLVVELNEASKDICGFPRDAIGKPFNSFAHECNDKCLEAIKETIKRKEPIEIYRLECHHKDRPDQVVTITTAPLIDQQGKFSGVVLVARDETRLAVLERDMGERQQFYNIIGKGEKMQKIYSLLEELADVQTTVLITGESGTGKELAAEAMHYKGVRSNKPLVKVNCSALTETLLESELFGHVKGAFTGAIKDKIGRFQRADGGTIFLDEIGDISPNIQSRLLRVLQEMEFEQVGDSTPVKVDVRVVAGTNQNLKEKVRLGKFREDLYYRLKVMEITMPPLRERREDIPILVDYFIEKFNKKLNKHIINISADVLETFMSYPWPGNVRELEHALEHAFILCHQPTITIEHLPPDFIEFSEEQISPLKESADEAQVILQALEKAGWNKSKAARLLGLNVRTIYRKIEKYNLFEKMQQNDNP